MKNLNAIAAIMCIFLVSCVSTSHIGTIGTRNIDYSATYEKSGQTMHKANVSLFLFIPIAIQDVNMVEIVDMALKKEGYDFMTNVDVSTTTICTYIYNSFTYKVEGIGWKKAGGNPVSENTNNGKTGYVVSKKDGRVALDRVEID